MRLIAGETIGAGERVIIEGNRIYPVRCTWVHPVYRQRCLLKRNHEDIHHGEHVVHTENGLECKVWSAASSEQFDDELLDT